MTASANMIVSQVDGVVNVPSQAVTETVTVRRDGKDSTQRVTTGLPGDSSTEVVTA